MTTIKQLSQKLNVDITTVYRHYSRLRHNQGKKFTAHVSKRYGKIVFDSHAVYMLQCTFKHNHGNINDNDNSRLLKTDNNTIKHLHNIINNLSKSNERLEQIALNAQNLQHTQELKIAQKSTKSNKSNPKNPDPRHQYKSLSFWEKFKLLF